MKHLNFFIIITILLLTSCATSENVIKDDAYYSPYDKDSKSDKELVVSNEGTFNTAMISSNSQYDYQSYYSEDETQKPKVDPIYEKTETVTDTNGVVYTTTETYYDENYLASNPSGSYPEDNYDYYYDDEDGDDSNWSVYFGVGMPYGYVGFGYGYPYLYSSYYNWYYDWWWSPYYYNPFYYAPYYYPYYPYYPAYPPYYPPHHPGGGHHPHPGGGLNPSGPRPNGIGGLHVANSNRPSSAGFAPTTSNKEEIESTIPVLSENGVKIHIGKGMLSDATVKSLKENKSIFVITPPVAALLTSKVIEKKCVLFVIRSL